MRRLLLLLLSLWSLQSTGYSATLYVVAAADVNHRAMGPTFGNTELALTTQLGSMPEANVKVVYPSRDHPNTSSGKALLDTLQHMAIEQGDSILVFYVGHGGFDSASSTHWLLYSDGNLARTDVENALRRHRDKAALLGLVTDACAQFFECPKEVLTPQDVPKLVKVPEGWNRLFFRSHGMANINSCEWGEQALANYKLDPNGGEPQMSKTTSFSQGLVDLLVEYRDSTEITWSQLFEELRDKTNDRFRDNFPSGREYLAPNGEKIFLQQQMPRKTGSLPEIGGGANPSKRLGAAFGEREGNQGVVFARYTDNNSPAKKMKLPDRPDEATQYSLEPGDVIVELDGQPVRDLEDFIDLLRTASLKMELVVERGGTRTKYLVFPREVDQTGEIERD